MIYWTIEKITYNYTAGYYFDLSKSMSFNVYYRNINNPNETILAETLLFKPVYTPYSVVEPMAYPSPNHQPVTDKNAEMYNQNFVNANLNIIRFQSVFEPNTLNYSMIFPKVLNNPFKNLSNTHYVSSPPSILSTNLIFNSFNLSSLQNIQSFQDFYNAHSIYTSIANDDYILDSIKSHDTFDSHTIDYLLGTTVQCISECSSEFTETLTDQDILEASHILTFIVLGVIFCSRIIKRSTP